MPKPSLCLIKVHYWVSGSKLKRRKRRAPIYREWTFFFFLYFILLSRTREGRGRKLNEINVKNISACERTVLLIMLYLISSSQTNKFLPWISLRVSTHISLFFRSSLLWFSVGEAKRKGTPTRNLFSLLVDMTWKFSQYSILVGWYIIHTQNFIPSKNFQKPKPWNKP